MKKFLSCALALVMCLGLAVPAFAAETRTETIGGITVTAEPNGTLSYTGTGTVTDEDAHAGFHLLLDATDGAFKAVVTINVGSGITVTDGFKEMFKEDFDSTGVTINFNFDYNPGAVTQPTVPVEPEAPAAQSAANPTNDKLEVNGSAADPTVYKINNSNYFKIRDVAALLNGTEKQFSVGYDAALNSVTATTGEGYEKQSGDLAGAASGGSQSAAPSNDAIYVNGQKIEAEVYKINGSNYFKLRDLGKALDFYVGWTAERGMYIETDKGYTE